MSIQLTPQQKQNLTSKLWRLNNLYTIVTKDKKKKIMKLNYSQRQVITKFKHPRKIILKSRQQGISTLYIAYYLDSCITKSNYSAGIQSYGKDEAKKLSQRAQIMWDNIPQAIKDALGIKIVKNNSEGMHFSNGSILKIGNFRGDTLQGLHVSELGKIAIKYPEKAKELQTGAFEAVGKGNKITIESTAEGKTGLFYEMWQKASLKALNETQLTPFDFEPIFLSWMQDPDCNLDIPQPINAEMSKYFKDLELKLNIVLEDTQKWWYISKAEHLSDNMKREYPSYPEEAFEQSVEGTYYKNEYATLKIRKDLYDPNLKVFTAWDLGVNDENPIGFWQIFFDGQKYIPRIIAEYQGSGFGLDHYREICNEFSRLYGFVYGEDFVPHDIKQREWTNAKTRFQSMKELGFKPTLVKKHSLLDGIEATRQFLKEVEIDESCTIIRTAIQNYRKKYDDKLGVFLNSPLHDEHSHPADMIRYMAMAFKYKRPKDIYAIGSLKARKIKNRNKNFNTTNKNNNGFDV